MDDEIIIILTDPPRELPKGVELNCSIGRFERYDATTLAGLRAARRMINQLIDARFPDTVDEE